MAALFLPAEQVSATALAAIIAVQFAVNLPSVTVWALFGSAMRRFLDSPPRRRGFNLVMALALVGTAVVMVGTQP